MIRIMRGWEEQQLRSRMLLQVHDELVFEAPAEELEHLERSGERTDGKCV